MVVALIICAVVVLFVFFLIIKAKAKRHVQTVSQTYETDCWMLKANEKDVSAISKAADLDGQEKKLLADLCKKAQTVSDTYIYKDDVSFKVLFFKAYKMQLEQHASEEEKRAMFTLRFKLEKAIDSALFEGATNTVAEGQSFFYKDISGKTWDFILQERSKKRFTFKIPAELAKSPQKPKIEAKVFLTFKTQKSTYTLQVTPVEYVVNDANGEHFLHADVLNDFRPIQRRQSKRLSVRLPCSFSAIKKNTEKSQNTEYKTYELSYSGELQDISATGCSIRCSIPLLQEQLLRLEFTLNGTETYTAIGMIVMTQKSLDGKEFVLHIKFVDIPLEVENRIYAFVYEYKL